MVARYRQGMLWQRCDLGGVCYGVRASEDLDFLSSECKIFIPMGICWNFLPAALTLLNSDWTQVLDIITPV